MNNVRKENLKELDKYFPNFFSVTEVQGEKIILRYQFFDYPRSLSEIETDTELKEGDCIVFTKTGRLIEYKKWKNEGEPI